MQGVKGYRTRVRFKVADGKEVSFKAIETVSKEVSDQIRMRGRREAYKKAYQYFASEPMPEKLWRIIANGLLKLEKGRIDVEEIDLHLPSLLLHDKDNSHQTEDWDTTHRCVKAVWKVREEQRDRF